MKKNPGRLFIAEATAPLLLIGKKCSDRLDKLEERLERLEAAFSQKLLEGRKLGRRNPKSKSCR